MQKQMPETVNFVRQVELNRTLEGKYPLAKLERLHDFLADSDAHDKGQVTAKIEFCHSVGFASIKGRVSAKLLVECQRCLNPMEIEIDGRFKFALVSSEEEAELLPDEFEPYLLEGEEQSIIELVEDELLLSLPMVIKHNNACSAVMTQQQEEIQAQKEAAHPFAALRDLKNDLGSDA